MSDLYIFLLGLIVTGIVSAAVGFLMWGAANEPRGTLLPQRREEQNEREPSTLQAEPARASSSPASAS